LWRARDWRRVGNRAPSVGIGPAFGRRGANVDDRLLFGGPSMLGYRLFEEGLVEREGDIECRFKISMKTPDYGR